MAGEGENALLQEAHEQMINILENMSDGFFTLDSKLVIGYFNKAAERLLDRKSTEVVGRSLFDDIFPESKGSIFEKRFIKTLKEKRAISFEAYFNPCENWYEVRVHHCGEGISVFFQITTERREAEECLRRYRFHLEKLVREQTAKLTEANRQLEREIAERKRTEEQLHRAQNLESLSILAGGIAHDFNNLLTAIIGNLSLAQRQASCAEDVSELLKEVKYASHQAKRLTHQLLTFAKGGAPIRKVTSLSRLLKDTISFVLSGSRVRYELFIQDNLWPARIDEGQISQVIHNLVINASQAMPGGGIIEVRAENVEIKAKDTPAHKEGEPRVTEGKYIKLSFRDQGIGIPAEHLPKIFDPYFTTKQEGTGLGLAVTYSIIKKHEGSIEVESKVGIGTAFFIYLPASQEQTLPA